MIKKICLVFFVLGLSFFIAAEDIGLTSKTNISMPYSSAWGDYSLSTTTSLWANSKLGKHWAFNFEGSYKYTDSRPVFLELNTLALYGSYLFPESAISSLTVTVGRDIFSEFSGKVFSSPADGVLIRLGTSVLDCTLFGAYTGFLQQPSTSIVMSLSDLNDIPTENPPLWGPLAPPRIIEGFSLSVPQFILNQNLLFSGILQQDLRENLVSNGARINTQYLGLRLSGPLNIKSTMFYNLYGYTNLGELRSNQVVAYISAFLLGGNVTIGLPQFFGSTINLEGLYSSGDPDSNSVYEGKTSGYEHTFTPITPSYGGIVFTARQSNLMYGSLGYSSRPFISSKNKMLSNLMFNLKGTSFFRSTTGPISYGTVKSGETGLYLGTEADAVFSARLFSDLGLSISAGVFFPSTIMADQTIKALISAYLSFTL